MSQLPLHTSPTSLPKSREYLSKSYVKLHGGVLPRCLAWERLRSRSLEWRVENQTDVALFLPLQNSESSARFCVTLHAIEPRIFGWKGVGEGSGNSKYADPLRGEMLKPILYKFERKIVQLIRPQLIDMKAWRL